MLFPFLVSLVGLFFLLVNTVSFYRTRKDKDSHYFILMVYLICLFVNELFCNIIGFYAPGSNFFLSHYYFIFQFILLSLFFRGLFTNAILKKAILFFLGLVLVLLAVQYYRTPSLYWEFNLFEIGSTSILLVLYAIIYLFQNFKNIKSNYIYFSNGLIIYLVSSSTIFLSGNTDAVIFTEPFLLDFWFFNSLFYILYQFLIFKEWQALKHIKMTKS
ncbi:hypothetical protein SAMN05216297_104157 [Flavobacterium phragmitis]|uniref:YhhN-like protein n=1 Tax=Flavobacterium phragmitis TaxID=739143 RepID=A0A1I1PHC5_9FLAO|nr:hypothetical protein SAMN05216297_104157 [Flavobacterium phragmitis]